jgi:hypothetical protein
VRNQVDLCPDRDLSKQWSHAFAASIHERVRHLTCTMDQILLPDCTFRMRRERFKKANRIGQKGPDPFDDQRLQAGRG